jgi:hypothetical protein
MTKTIIALSSLLLVVGCGSSTPSGTPSDMTNGGAGGGGGGGSAGGGGGGGGSISDMSSSGGFCGGQTCTGGTSCCIVGMTPMCSSSCPDGGFTAECQKPSDCPSAMGACCIAISNYMPTSVTCKANAQCVPAIMPNGMGTDRACVTASDCTDNGTNGTSLPDCCTSVSSGQHVCFSKAYLMAVPSLQQQFTCP